ncbi:MAG TPA: hypothetical protein VMF64_14795 [Steroidobacteraceae bacterium]|nr:hypothetical protein [Steroidobacteraceae bacterium]
MLLVILNYILNYLGALDQRIWWFFRAASTLHFIGLSLLVGALLVMDLRALGVVRGISHTALAGLARVAVLGLAINVISGLVMLASKPVEYWHAWPFRYKMVALAVALLNAAWFTTLGQRRLRALSPEAPLPVSIRASAALSLAAWLVVILLGRAIFEFASGG